MNPADFEHLDDLTSRIDSGATFSIGIVRHRDDKRLFAEVVWEQGDERGGYHYAYAPLAIPDHVDLSDGHWEAIAAWLGTEDGL